MHFHSVHRHRHVEVCGLCHKTGYIREEGLVRNCWGESKVATAYDSQWLHKSGIYGTVRVGAHL